MPESIGPFHQEQPIQKTKEELRAERTELEKLALSEKALQEKYPDGIPVEAVEIEILRMKQIMTLFDQEITVTEPSQDPEDEGTITLEYDRWVKESDLQTLTWLRSSLIEKKVDALMERASRYLSEADPTVRHQRITGLEETRADLEQARDFMDKSTELLAQVEEYLNMFDQDKDESI